VIKAEKPSLSAAAARGRVEVSSRGERSAALPNRQFCNPPAARHCDFLRLNRRQGTRRASGCPTGVAGKKTGSQHSQPLQGMVYGLISIRAPFFPPWSEAQGNASCQLSGCPLGLDFRYNGCATAKFQAV